VWIMGYMGALRYSILHTALGFVGELVILAKL